MAWVGAGGVHGGTPGSGLARVTDLRAVPAAALAWVAAVHLTGGAGPGRAWGVVGAAAALTPGLVAAAVRASRAARRRPEHGSGTTSRATWGTSWGTAWGTALLAAVAVAAVAVSAAVQLGARDAALRALEHAVHVEGTVVGDPRPSHFGATRVRLVLAAVERQVPTGRPRDVSAVARAVVRRAEVVVRGGPEWADVEHGASVRAAGRATPLVGERAVAEVRAGPPVVVAPPRGQAALVNHLRAGLVRDVAHLPADSRGLVPGAAVGDTRAVPADLMSAMRDTSLVHVTAVSGSHFSVVLAALLVLGAVLRLPTGVRAVLTSAGVVGFTVLVHPGPAVLRAAVMGVVVVLGLLLGRPSQAVPALAWAVVLLVCWDPWTAREVGFHLSVVATAAIVLLGPPLAARLPGPVRLRSAVAVAASAQAGCGPLLVLLDPVLPLYAVPANLLAVPALLPATLGGLVATLARPVVPVIADAGLVASDLSVRWVAGVARGFAALPGARVPWPAGAGGAWALAALTALALTLVLRLPRRDART